jgi:fumarylacetoacetase
VTAADAAGFGIENLPYGVVAPPGQAPRLAVRIGERALDLAALHDAGLLDVGGIPAETLHASVLNDFIALGPHAWAALRECLIELLAESAPEPGIPAGALLPLSDVRELLPVRVGDYVDFYSSLEHATNCGRILRPNAEPLPPNWRQIPLGYHGRSASVVASDTPVHRPCGLLAPVRPGQPPTYGAEPWLDFELELAFITGPGPLGGERIRVERAWEHVFGFVLVNDWSARSIQRFEAQPLGPFLAKSFATSMSNWVVPAAALQPLRVAGVAQEPAPAEHLRAIEPRALDLDLEVELQETIVCRVNARHLYWSPAQQLAHATSNGAVVRAGDVFASGTVSGAEPSSQGCLLELSWGARRPVELADGGRRTFLEDGDTVVMRGSGRLPSGARIALGEVRGQVRSAAG